jgi:hypothetical protein|tara:strand:+ start:131 stop:811 length:681 start_codon:yes stop_codon:yes gene_type:complete
MAYNYLSLANEICRRLNETELTTSNFATATGFYAQTKDAINATIRDINQKDFSWPFNHNTDDIILTAGELRYPLPENVKYTDFDTVRILRDTSLGFNEARRLKQLSYDEYIDKYIDQESETDSTKGSAPEYVIRSQDGDIIFAPMPNKAYTIEYEFFMIPADLDTHDDIPTIPFRFKHVIVDGAMYHSYMFRDNLESASLALRKFEDGLKQMRTLVVNENLYARAV